MSFDGSPQVCTRTYGATDQLLPPLGTIQLLPSSLPSQEQDLVTGNVNRDITGNVLYLLTGNRNNTTTLNLSDTVNGNHDYLLQQKLTHTVQGPTVETKHGAHMHSNSSSRIDNFTGTVSRFFQAETKEMHPEQWLQKFEHWAHYSNYYVKINWIDIAVSFVSKVSVATTHRYRAADGPEDWRVGAYASRSTCEDCRDDQPHQGTRHQTRLHGLADWRSFGRHSFQAERASASHAHHAV